LPSQEGENSKVGAGKKKRRKKTPTLGERERGPKNGMGVKKERGEKEVAHLLPLPTTTIGEDAKGGQGRGKKGKKRGLAD